MLGEASSDDAAFLEAEIAAATWSRASDDHVVDQVELQDSAGFENPTGEPHIGFGRGRITGRMIMHQDESVGGVCDHRLKDLSWVAERFIDAALANRADLNEMLFGVEKNNAQGFPIEKAHLRTEIGNCLWTIDR